jgi:hypothetical protein
MIEKRLSLRPHSVKPELVADSQTRSLFVQSQEILGP